MATIKANMTTKTAQALHALEASLAKAKRGDLPKAELKARAQLYVGGLVAQAKRAENVGKLLQSLFRDNGQAAQGETDAYVQLELLNGGMKAGTYRVNKMRALKALGWDAASGTGGGDKTNKGQGQGEGKGKPVASSGKAPNTGGVTFAQAMALVMLKAEVALSPSDDKVFTTLCAKVSDFEKAERETKGTTKR